MPIKRFFFILLASCSFFFAQSQESRSDLPLKEILKKIELKHQVNFNYIEDEIAIFILLEPSENWSLGEKIEYLKKETKLHFSVVNDKYYNIINDKRLDKPLCAYILDFENNKGISDANIKILDTDISIISNDKGYFEIPAISPNLIQISHINYQTIEISPKEIYKTNCPKIFLKEKVVELPEIVTQLYLTQGIYKKNDGSIIIKPKQIGHLPGLTEPDVFKTMQQIPGVISVDKNISNINVRGGTHDQNLILWNGIRLFQTGHFFGMISALNPNLAHNIKFMKNGSSAFYGESTSSVIDISTHTNNIENSKGAVGLNMINGDFYAKLKISKTSNLEISGRRSFTDFLENSPTFKNYSNRIFQNTQVTNTSSNNNIIYNSKKNFYFYDFTAQFHQKLDKKTDFFIDLITISNQLELNQSKIEELKTISRNSFLKQNTYGGNLNFKSNWNLKNTIEANLYASYYKVDSENESIESNQIFNQENDVLDTGLKIQNNYDFSNEFKFKIGYQFNEIGVRNTDQINSPIFFRKIKDVLKNHAAILETNYTSKNEKLKSSIGLRANYFQELSKFILEPRLQLNYKITKSISLEILGEQKNQTTSQIIDLQKDFLGIEKRRWILSNDVNIPVIRSEQISAGFTYKQKSWLITWDTFYKKVKGITSMSQGFQNQLEFETINGDYKVQGTELLLQKQINNFTAWINYTYTKNNYNFESYVSSVFPNNFEIRHNFNIATIYDNKNLKLALGAKFHTGKPTTNPQIENPILTPPSTATINYKSPNSDNLENYFELDFSAGYVFHFSEKSNLNLGFAIENITNQKNIINQYYRVNLNTNTIEKVVTVSLERTLNAFMRYSF